MCIRDSLCDNKGKNIESKNPSMESEEKNSNNGKEGTLFKVIGVSNSEEITF